MTPTPRPQVAGNVPSSSIHTGPHLRQLLRRYSHCCSHLCSLGWVHSLQQLSHLRRVVRLASGPEDKRIKAKQSLVTKNSYINTEYVHNPAMLGYVAIFGVWGKAGVKPK